MAAPSVLLPRAFFARSVFANFTKTTLLRSPGSSKFLKTSQFQTTKHLLIRNRSILSSNSCAGPGSLLPHFGHIHDVPLKNERKISGGKENRGEQVKDKGRLSFIVGKLLRVLLQASGITLVYIVGLLTWKHEIKPTAPILVHGSRNSSGLQLTLHQFGSCPFCCKVRSFLNFYGFRYEVVEVDPLWKWRSHKGKKVPTLEISSHGEHLEVDDSSVIISLLKTYMVSEGERKLDDILQCYPYMFDKQKKKSVRLNGHHIMYGTTENEANRREESEWRAWVDNNLVHTISPNIYRTWDECIEAFHHFARYGEWDRLYGTAGVGVKYAEIYIGALSMFFLAKYLKKKYKLKENVRQSLFDACNDWLKAVGNRRFMGGNTPNLADLAVFGVLCAFEETESFRDLMVATKLRTWYGDVKTSVSAGAGAEQLKQMSWNK